MAPGTCSTESTWHWDLAALVAACLCLSHYRQLIRTLQVGVGLLCRYEFEPQPSYCAADYARILVRTSTDQGVTWSDGTVLVTPTPNTPWVRIDRLVQPAAVSLHRTPISFIELYSLLFSLSCYSRSVALWMEAHSLTPRRQPGITWDSAWRG